MASKSQEPGGSPIPPLFDNQFASSIKDSAAQIWQAGLGAFAKAQGEGSKVYESLVKEGVTIQRKTQAAAEEKLTEVSGKMSKLTEDVQTKAGQQWDRLEAIFEERVAKAMSRMGAPSRQDFAALNKRIDALEAQVAKLAKPATSTKSSAARPAVKKAAVKTVAKKATPAKKAAPKRKPL